MNIIMAHPVPVNSGGLCHGLQFVSEQAWYKSVCGEMTAQLLITDHDIYWDGAGLHGLRR